MFKVYGRPMVEVKTDEGGIAVICGMKVPETSFDNNKCLTRIIRYQDEEPFVRCQVKIWEGHIEPKNERKIWFTKYVRAASTTDARAWAVHMWGGRAREIRVRTVKYTEEQKYWEDV